MYHKSATEAAVNLKSEYIRITVQKPLWNSDSINLCVFFLSIFRTQTMWSQSETLWRTTARCSVFTKVTSSGCRLWTAWRRVRHHGTRWSNPLILLSESMIRECLCVCVLSCVWPPGYSYGCVVRKKVVFLEELKRDTPDFGECSLNPFILIPNQMSASLPGPKSKQGDNSDWQL